MRMRRYGEGRGVACPRLSPGGGVAMATAPRSAAMEVTGSRFCGSTERGRWARREQSGRRGERAAPTAPVLPQDGGMGLLHAAHRHRVPRRAAGRRVPRAGRAAVPRRRHVPGGVAPRGARGGTAGGTGGRGPGAAGSHRAPRDVPCRGSSLLQTASNTRLKGGITATATTGGSTPRSARGSDPQVPTCGAVPHRPARGGGAARQRHRAEAVTSRAERAVGGRAAIPGEPKRTFCPARTAHETFLALLRSAGAAFAVPAESHTAGKWAVCSYPVLPVHFSVFSIGKIARTFYKTGCKETMFLWQTPGRCNTS